MWAADYFDQLIDILKVRLKNEMSLCFLEATIRHRKKVCMDNVINILM